MTLPMEERAVGDRQVVERHVDRLDDDRGLGGGSYHGVGGALLPRRTTTDVAAFVGEGRTREDDQSEAAGWQCASWPRQGERFRRAVSDDASTAGPQSLCIAAQKELMRARRQ